MINSDQHHSLGLASRALKRAHCAEQVAAVWEALARVLRHDRWLHAQRLRLQRRLTPLEDLIR
jgi:hypothetical protein